MIMRAHLEAFIERERQATRDDYQAMLERPLAERIADGEAIADLTLGGQVGEEAVLHAPVNESKFRRGDSLRLRPLSAPEGIEATFLEDDRNAKRLKVRLARGATLPPQPWVLEPQIVDFSTILTQAVATLFEQDGHRPALALLTDHPAPVTDPFKLRDYRAMGQRLGLPTPQSEAFAHALAATNFMTIKGPPGAGKTTVIARIVTQAVSEGARVLVTAMTHKAVNHALEAVHNIAPHLDIVKLGPLDQGQDLSEGIRREARIGPHGLATEGPGIAGAALMSAGKLALKAKPFDLVICDEASQVTLPLAVCAFITGKRWVFVGDERQLPPVLKATHDDDPCARSIFAHLYAPGTTPMLNETYRLNRTLTDWVSREFYDGQLKPTLRSSMRRLPIRTQGPWRAVLDPAQALVIGRIDHADARDVSAVEGRVAAAIAASLVDQGLSRGNIAVLSPFRAQNRLIRACLAECLPQGADDETILVDTVERAQGQEREAVILSLTASDPDYAASLVPFLLGAERLNVMVTRARTKCILLVSPKLLEVRSEDLTSIVLLNRLHRMFRELPVIDLSAEAAQLATDAISISS